jgi:hypothetical protein
MFLPQECKQQKRMGRKRETPEQKTSFSFFHPNFELFLIVKVEFFGEAEELEICSKM